MENSKQTHSETPVIVQKYLEHRKNHPQKRFDRLPGHQKRAINSEAEIQVDAYRLSKTFGEWTKDQKNAALLHEAHAEYYAANPVLIEKLTNNLSNEMYLFPDTADRLAHRQHWAQRLADKIDAKALGKTKVSSIQRYGFKETAAFAAGR